MPVELLIQNSLHDRAKNIIYNPTVNLIRYIGRTIEVIIFLEVMNSAPLPSTTAFLLQLANIFRLPTPAPRVSLA